MSLLASFILRRYTAARRVRGLAAVFDSRYCSWLKRLGRKWAARSRMTLYQRWRNRVVATRGPRYPFVPEPGLISLLMTVWNTPVEYLRVLAESVLAQGPLVHFEWIVLDNGSSDEQTRDYLERELAGHPNVRLLRVEKNLGIVGGMRVALEAARGRYVVPIDSDDYLTPDCLAIITSVLQRQDYPPILYSDEDHLLGDCFLQPFLKPSWDPVLFLNSSYIAHITAFDRNLALRLGVYTEVAANGSHDWDTFFRFWAGGAEPIHIPEILYSWRHSEQSTAGSIHSKSYIFSSHRFVLERFLSQHPAGERFELVRSPLFPTTPDWWFRRRRVKPRPMLTVVIGSKGGNSMARPEAVGYPTQDVTRVPSTATIRDLAECLRGRAKPGALVCLVAETVDIQGDEWPWEALGTFELHGETAMVGGRISSPDGRILDAGFVFGYGDGIACPDRGRSLADPGYAAQMWKKRSVDAVSSRLCIFDAEFLQTFLAEYRDRQISLPFLGAWAGAEAYRRGRRVVYSPFIHGVTADPWEQDTPPEERDQFVTEFADLARTRRYYHSQLCTSGRRPYTPAA